MGAGASKQQVKPQPPDTEAEKAAKKQEQAAGEAQVLRDQAEEAGKKQQQAADEARVLREQVEELRAKLEKSQKSQLEGQQKIERLEAKLQEAEDAKDYGSRAFEGGGQERGAPSKLTPLPPKTGESQTKINSSGPQTLQPAPRPPAAARQNTLKSDDFLAFTEMHTEMADKFSQGSLASTLRMGNYGTMDLFDEGISGIVGSMDVQPLRGMYAEHCLSSDSKDMFRPSNSKFETTPQSEWTYVVGSDALLEEGQWEITHDTSWSDEDRARGHDEGSSRNRKTIKELLEHEKNKEANLLDVEIIALRLYTGPMYAKYNKILRTVRPGEAGREQRKKLNLYGTTINLIVSGLVKLSRCTIVDKNENLWRGMGGIVLPKEFVTADAQGYRGGVEPGFMSTSLEQAVALRYSGSKMAEGQFKERSLPIVIQIQLGKTSVGADVSWLSQYKNEKEILYPPLTHMEILDIQKTEDLHMVQVRLTVNQKFSEFEKAVSSRKDKLIETAQTIVWEMRHWCKKHLTISESLELSDSERIRLSWESLHDLCMEKVDELETVLVKDLEDIEPTWYNSNFKYTQAFDRLMSQAEEGRQRLAQSIWEFAPQAQQSELLNEEAIYRVTGLYLHSISAMETLCADNKENRATIIARREQLLKFQSEHLESVRLADKAKTHFRLARCLLNNSKFEDALKHNMSASEIFVNEAISGKPKLQELPKEDKGRKYQSLRSFVVENVASYFDAAGSTTTNHQRRAWIKYANCLVFTGEILPTGESKTAEVHYSCAQEIYRRMLPEKIRELKVMYVTECIGKLRHARSRFEEALEQYNQVLEFRTKYYNGSHLEIASAHFNKAVTLRKKGDYEQALKDYERSLTMKRYFLGHQHADVAQILDLKAIVQQDLEMWDEAQKNFEESLQIKQLLHGPDTEPIADCVRGLGDVLHAQQKHSEALARYREALAKYQTVHNHKDYRKTAIVLRCIANALSSIGRNNNLEAALEHYDKSLAMTGRTEGEKTLDYAKTQYFKGLLLKKMGKYQEAEKFLDMSMILRKEIYCKGKSMDKGHQDLSKSIIDLGTLLMHKSEAHTEEQRTQRQEKALQLFLRVLRLHLEVFGELKSNQEDEQKKEFQDMDEDTQSHVLNKALEFVAKWETAKPKTNHEQRKISLLWAEAFRNIACLWQEIGSRRGQESMNRFPDSEKSFKCALQLLEPFQNDGNQNGDTKITLHLAETYEMLGAFYSTRDDINKALEMYQQAFERRKQLNQARSLAKTMQKIVQIHHKLGQPQLAYDKMMTMMEQLEKDTDL